ncbi:coagulase/fibrinolysin [Yersinia rohdei]|uniref:Coagulase/fibrinolysin n=1 Tax=Yersinia rohdei TaxID=29485 RepID=A0ABM5SFP8_YERRO|nr:omptin family outer membrane protease [Yersinia rohdei]AJJ12157.1 coagulase/fibrinolysin [Yersinia rohdei]MDN0093570.1 omptin family outer membrane protease [Yersinia rohdei]
MNITLATKKSASALALLMVCHTAVASYQSNTNNNLTISTSLGLLNSDSKELVYLQEKNGHKLSQLDWKAENTPIIKADISWDFLSRLTLSAKGWSTLTSSDGAMDDYDWTDLKQAKWTHSSHHDKTNLNYANEIDLNAKFWFLKQENYRIAMMSGYQRYNNSWTAYGGKFNYDNGKNIFNGSDSIIGISYKQKFDMPYVGLAGSYRYRSFEFNTSVKYSQWVKATGTDEHHLRNTTFTDTSKNSCYYGVAIDAGYYITDNTKFLVEAGWNKYSEAKAGTQIFDRTTGVASSESRSAGISHQDKTISAGLQYKF